jgi:hypothetical protein
MASQVTKDCVEIYYVPIGVSTFVPITKHNIEESYVRYGCVSTTDVRFKKLLRILNSSETKKSEIDNDIIRVKIKFTDSKIIYVDNEGGVEISAAQRKLTISGLDRVTKILKSITKKRIR